MSTVDLASRDVEWIEFTPAGAHDPARMVPLFADAALGVRTVLAEFTDGWRRDAVGNQPAGEELVLVEGELSMGGLSASPGSMLVATPHATRSATIASGATRAVVFFTGAAGGWADGEHATPGTLTLTSVDADLRREPTEGLGGEITGELDVAGRVFEHDVEIVWPGAMRYASLAAGTPAPEVGGLAVVRHHS